MHHNKQKQFVLIFKQNSETKAGVAASLYCNLTVAPYGATSCKYQIYTRFATTAVGGRKCRVQCSLHTIKGKFINRRLPAREETRKSRALLLSTSISN
jgi:hypothetical protein